MKQVKTQFSNWIQFQLSLRPVKSHDVKLSK